MQVIPILSEQKETTLTLK